MKITLLVILALFPIQSYSQLNVSTYFENDSLYPVELHPLPYDDTRLVQLNRADSYGINGSYFHNYEILELTNSSASNFVVPLCSNLSTKPAFLTNGILLGADFLGNGTELVYFDGTNVVDFDLNPTGDSHPIIFTVNDEVFVEALDGTSRQLYLFHESTMSIEQISNESVDMLFPLGRMGDKIYYLTHHTLGSGVVESRVRIAQGDNSNYIYSTVHGIDAMDSTVTWQYGVSEFDKFFIQEYVMNSSSSFSTTYNVISIDSNNYASVVHSMAPISGIYSLNEMGLFLSNNNLYSYGLDSNLYVSQDGLSFNIAATHTSRLNAHYLAENGDIFLSSFLSPSDSTDFLKFDNGLQSVVTGRHMHVLNEIDNDIYLSDYGWGNVSKLRVYNTVWDMQDSVEISIGAHSPVENASVMYQGKFTFLYSNTVDSTDVLQLDWPSMNVKDLEQDTELAIYPNPINQDEVLNVYSDEDAELLILTTSGQVLYSQAVLNGLNIVNVNSLSSGMYYIKCGPSIKPLVVL